MADRRITQLTQTTNPNIDSVLPVVNANVTLKVTVDDLVKASSWGNYKINNLTPVVNNVAAPINPNYQIPIQFSDGSAPKKINLDTLYPKPIETSTINLTFNNTTRSIQASLKNRSLQPIHFSTGSVEGSAIAVGTITQQNIDPNAKLAGAVGGGNDRVFFENDQAVTADYTISTGKNAMTAGPITINSGITVTVPDGSTWTVV
jgi:hypothetical protein